MDVRLSRAKQHVEALTGVYIHLAVFAAVLTLLAIINAMTDPVWWVQWPFLGWGIGVLAHAAAVFGRTKQRITRWQLRKIHDLRGKV